MLTIPEIQAIFEDHGGMMRTADLSASKVYYKDIQTLIAKGHIEKVRYGYYQWRDEKSYSEAATIVRLFPDGILCMATALFYHGYSDRISAQWCVAVSKDSGKSRFRIDYPFVRPYFAEPKLLNIGVTQGEIDGVPVKIYDKERTICDCLRYAGKMDSEIFNKAIQSYLADTSRNVPNLITYAKHLRVTRKVKYLIGVWL